jgi:hypothetical protein
MSAEAPTLNVREGAILMNLYDWFVGCFSTRQKSLGIYNTDPRRSLTSVALYARETANDTFRYRFVGAISIQQLTDSIRDYQER